jgi:hypothetical protein
MSELLRLRGEVFTLGTLVLGLRSEPEKKIDRPFTRIRSGHL